MNDTLTPDLVQAIISCSHRLKAVGRSMGAVTSRGGAWGLMKSLDQQGPQTIPELARARPVSRQHIRALAQSLIRRGWIASVPNPAHRRSFLLQLTPGGRQALETMDRQIATPINEWLEDLEEQSIEQAIRVLNTLAEGLSSRLMSDGS
jgi:DNA-binding MarR family transcriptional regulator